MKPRISISDIGKKNFKITACLGYSNTIVNIDEGMKELQKALPPLAEIADRLNNYYTKKYEQREEIFVPLADFEKIVHELKVKTCSKRKLKDIYKITIRCHYESSLFSIKPLERYAEVDEYKPKKKTKPFKLPVSETGEEVRGGIGKDTIDITNLQKTEAVSRTNVPPPKPPTEEELRKAESMKNIRSIFDIYENIMDGLFDNDRNYYLPFGNTDFNDDDDELD